MLVNESDDPVCVAFAADNIVSKGLAAATRSVADRLAEQGRPATIFVVDCGLSRRTRRAVSRSLRGTTASVAWLPVTGAASDLLLKLSVRSTRPYPASAYARLLLPALLPPEVTRVIYFDADMIARHDLLPLWEADMGSDVLFAVRDLPLENGNARRIARTVDQARFPYPAESVYFQSGLLVIDVKSFRAERLAEQAIDFLGEYPSMHFPDQDALNALATTRTRLIDPRWNQMSAVYRYPDKAKEPSPFDADTLRELQDDPFIVHYSGRPKPWELFCDHPLVGDWYAALDRTEWKGWRPSRLNAAVSRAFRASRVLRKRIYRGLRRLG